MKTIVGGALGECVHVAGITNVLRLAESQGWRTVYLGPAVSIDRFLRAIRDHDPDVVAISYRLTPETARAAVAGFAAAVRNAGLEGRRFVFGGTPPVVEQVVELEFFERTFSGKEPLEEVVALFRDRAGAADAETGHADVFVERTADQYPVPLLRHHYGQPTVAATIRGIEEIAEAGALDVISLGTDQDAQENFFHPERQDPKRTGAGGVPVRSETDLRRLYQASRRGNCPLMRVYSGTDDHIRFADVALRTINNAWCATSLFWFNQLDGRGPLGLEQSIAAHQELMRWHADRNVPVEANEPHHWGMRDAPDVVFVAASFLSAYNAKMHGVQDYIVQFMFDSPPGLSDAMDLAKMLACIELTERLAGDGFRVYRQTRTGLLSHPVDEHMALGQVGASVYLQMALRPHIVHIVSACEADHAATTEDIVKNSKLARWVIKTSLEGAPNMTSDPMVQARKEELVAEAELTLDAIRGLAAPGVMDPWTDPETLAGAVHSGILDAPHLKGHPLALGTIRTAVIAGACRAVDPDTGRPLSELERLSKLMPAARR